ncbi:peptidoglycan-binding protein [Ruegeria sp. 2205SS24-7]|uniref:peptidoglycan-binding protein n=1 Tax=Ruegeria discodermiae TaxID=3064389 RepID=UPI0027408BD5|nr:peptidoglycan-binding protein [Ruegeria sp. 2205SS24-7]MDP5218776.1 peptidoglycan-binding protein [Ruegeria sp. 2205SS24-7]
MATLLRKGSKGKDVKTLQTDLNKAKAKPKLAVDGIFGPLTEAAVKAFQKANPPLKVDGLAGKNTLAALKAALSGPTKPAKMDHKLKTKRMDFELTGSKQQIWVRQNWDYVYKTKGKVSKWTSKEKKDFHIETEKIIRKSWGGKFVLDVSGTSDFAKYFAGKKFTVFFDVDPRKKGKHWTVFAMKIPKGGSNVSKVNWGKQEITLDTEDLQPANKGAGDGVKMDVAAHEFGHAIGQPDEYKKSNAFHHHKKSIMNLGNQVKKRHAKHLVEQLNKMIPNTSFSVKSVN